MPIEEQVAVIYGGVRGHIDNIEPSRIEDYEKAFLQYIRSSHQQLLNDIRDAGMLTEDLDKRLNDVVSTFAEQFTATK